MFRQTIDDLNFMLTDRGMPKDLCNRIRGFFYETREVNRVRGYKELMAEMSPSLRAEVARAINEQWLKKVWYLADPKVSVKLLVACAQRVEHGVFARGEHFGEKGTLHIVNRGLVGRLGRLLRQGNVWGEDFCLSDITLMDRSESIALVYCECLMMHYQALRQILNRFPEEKVAIRKAAVKIAVIRGIMFEAMRRDRSFKPKSWSCGDNRDQSTATGLECGTNEMGQLQYTVMRTENAITDLEDQFSEQQAKLDMCLAYIQRYIEAHHARS